MERLRGENEVRKLLFGLLAVVLAISACGGGATSTPEPTTAPEATATAVEPTPAAQPTEEPVVAFEEGPCPFDVPEGAPLVCGFVVVPEDHNDPDGATIKLAVAVVKDETEEHQPDPVIMLAGGPGEKVMQNALAVAMAFQPIRSNRDFIIFDQRGVGLSEPALECPEWEQELYDLLDEANPAIILEESYDALMECRDRLVSEGRNLSAYNTTQSAADVNAIRIALGYDEVNLWGGSYGSFLAQAVMRDHPEGVRSAVIESVWPLEISFFVEANTAVPNAILRLIDTCAADDACDSAYPNLQQVLFDTIDQLNAEPVLISVTNPLNGQSYDALLTGDAVRGNLVSALYLTPLIPALPQAIYDVYNGDHELMTQLTSQKLVFYEAMSRGMEYSVVCAEDLIDRTPDDMLDIVMALPRQLRSEVEPEDAIEYGIFGICENWPVEEADPSFKDPLVSDIPTLILEGELDPVTPPEYGQLVASRLSNAYFFEFPGFGHAGESTSECALNITAAFIEDPTARPDGACIAEMPGLAFDVPREAPELVLEPFADEERGFSGLVPAGWTESVPLNYQRGQSALDPTTLVQDATDASKDELFNVLASQLGFDASMKSVATAEVGNFTWDFYEFQVRAYPVDLALTEDGGKAYFVLLVSPEDERDALYEQVFLPVVEALGPVQ
jgi:pimeloyl-ACP methyl ester carboxylesterase